MKFFIILLIFVGSVILASNAFAWCPQNEDWSDRPCYGAVDVRIEKERSNWEPYFDFKGSEWMESKKQEMTLATQNDTLSDWIELTSETQAHHNVHEYYFILGEAPNLEGIFVDYEIVPWDDFEYEFQARAAIFTKNMIRISTLEAGQEYYVIQKVDFSDDNFAENSTFSAVVGYAIQKGDKMIPFPKGENVTDAEHQEFAEKTRKQRIEFSQESEIAKSFEFVVEPEKPFYVKSSLIIDESGKYTKQYYKKLKFSPAIISSNMGGLVVIDNHSKAIDDHGACKNDKFRYLIKHDYSTTVCVDPSSAFKLKERGWAI